MPDAALQPARPHAALIWLIRGTYVVTAIFLAILLLFILIAPLMVFFKAITDVSNPPGYRITMVFFGLILILFYGFIVKRNYHKFYKKFHSDFCKFNADTVANFSIIFAFFFARVFHYSLPAHLPKAVNDHVWLIFRDPGDKGNRMLWTWLAFYLSYRLIKRCLLRILELNPPNPPQNQVPSVPSVPPDPSDHFVPFDPYDLSKNRPTHPL